MIILNDRIAKLPSSSRLIDLINFCGKQDVFETTQICVPNGIGFNKDYKKEDIGLISKSTCNGCLCCLETKDAESFNEDGIPTNNQFDNSFFSISDKLFRGKFIQIGPNPQKFWRHTESNEKEHTTPIVANLLLFLSTGNNDVIMRCSPNWELSIDTNDPEDPREGHLDFAIVNCKAKKLIVGEVKSSVNNLLRDRRRDQWNRYYDSIKNQAEGKGFKYLFTYFIGGDEYSLYPPNVHNCPTTANNRKEEFYEFILKENKSFISLEALRALKLQRLSTHKYWSWEEWLLKIFSAQDTLGLISGGLVNINLKLKSCPW